MPTYFSLKRAVLAFAGLFLPSLAQTATLVSTLPNANISAGGLAFADWNIGPTRQSIAVPFFTGSQAGTVESVTVAIMNAEQYSNNFGPNLKYSAFIYSTYYYGGSGGFHIPFVPVGVFESIEAPYNYFPSDLEDVAFSSQAIGAITLDANQIYWLVLEDQSNDISPAEYNNYGTSQANGYQTWVQSPGFSTLDSIWTRAVDTRVTYRYSDWSSNDWAQSGGTGGRAFALYGTAIPEPSVTTLIVLGGILILGAFRCRISTTSNRQSPGRTSQST